MNGTVFDIKEFAIYDGSGVRQTALLVKSYIDLGGRQLQMNAVNRDRLIEARKNPQDYRNLIVRVWG